MVLADAVQEVEAEEQIEVDEDEALEVCKTMSCLLTLTNLSFFL